MVIQFQGLMLKEDVYRMTLGYAPGIQLFLDDRLYLSGYKIVVGSDN